MKKLRILLIFLAANHLNAQSVSVQIQDSLTLFPIPFSTVSFSNNKGVISDEDGMFELIKISYLIKILYLSHQLGIKKFHLH